MPITRAEEHFWTGTGVLTDATPLPAIGSALILAGGASARGNGVAVNPASAPGVPIYAIATEAATLVNEEFSVCRMGFVDVIADSSNAIAFGDQIAAGVGAGLFRVAIEGDMIIGRAVSTAPGSAAGERFILNFFGAGGAHLFSAVSATVDTVKCQTVAFVEAGAGTSYTGTIAIPAGSTVLDIEFRSTVLWDGTSASLIIGDDDDPNGYATATDLKATDMLVGEVFRMAGQTENWLGNNGVYLVAATGLISASYYAAANNIIGLVTPGAADGTAGRSFMTVWYSTPTAVASTNV